MADQNTRIELRNRAEHYANQRGFSLQRPLGFGNDGAVWETSVGSALKIEERLTGYERELAAYRRLQEANIVEILGFSVPQLIDHDDRLLAIEMTFVFPPCILDFAKSYLDHPPDFSAEVLCDWRSETEELFEADWPTVRKILGRLEALGIYYFDAKPGNIRFLPHS